MKLDKTIDEFVFDLWMNLELNTKLLVEYGRYQIKEIYDDQDKILALFINYIIATFSILIFLFILPIPYINKLTNHQE
jgi:hypothetical protein